jgi:hypothetical protein
MLVVHLYKQQVKTNLKDNTVDLNRDPTPVSSLGSISSFRSSSGFDSLLDPMISVELDLSNKI